ncbi:MAG: hypothetical protein AAF502_21845 [Bacteroidota bacterium]
MALRPFTKIKGGSDGSEELVVSGQVSSRLLDGESFLFYDSDQIIAGAPKTLPPGAIYVRIQEQGGGTLDVNNTELQANEVYTDGDPNNNTIRLDGVVIGVGTYKIYAVYPYFDVE